MRRWCWWWWRWWWWWWWCYVRSSAHLRWPGAAGRHRGRGSATVHSYVQRTDDGGKVQTGGHTRCQQSQRSPPHFRHLPTIQRLFANACIKSDIAARQEQHLIWA